MDNKSFFLFLDFIDKALRNLLYQDEISHIFNNVSTLVGIIVMKIEKLRIHFLSDGQIISLLVRGSHKFLYLGRCCFSIIKNIQDCELSSVSSSVHLCMLMTHTSLSLSAYDPTTLGENEVQKWLKSNKLALNVKKTKYMINGSHYRLTHLTGDLNVNVNSQQLTRVTNYR